ncbi:uncharacterized protein DUF1460 [Serratia fonticola]|uniref:Uncharacterized protein DUF1460 n=1 Tax=Serratia fonticola TaxID=47917 RepID=A0A542BMB5_SERFO|nr:DUF1460 domain-containing protein [Serratia fonticola]TQI79577.1 uncharacterized protein DUF1460 [Serratia fonticola]TQI98397.1 uncharacterized protein DUF1460 [Serratia fonticola]TVZ67926.1 uncharacterized protein DUF1460 [Serratia fonticola]
MRWFTLLILSTTMMGCSSKQPSKIPVESHPQTVVHQTMTVTMDDYTVNKLQAVLALHAAVPEADKGRTIDLLSQAFLDTPYVANRLVGSANTPERLVIDFRGLDCFTYLDYIEALRTATSENEFSENVIQTRYVNGDIDFLHRKHFFTDWVYTQHVLADDITAKLSVNAVTVVKQLNRKTDGDVYLPGIPVVERSITYIPSEFIDDKVIGQLQTGDYIGIYTKLPGLDVTHTGFFIMTPQGPVLRHASSRKESMKVMDSTFSDYVLNTPGIVVLRPR